MKTILLKGGFVVTPQNIIQADIGLRDGNLELNPSETAGAEVMDITGKYVVPGFVDIHFHGYNLFEFTAGLYDPKTDTFDDRPQTYQHELNKVSGKVAEFGVTSFYIATWAAPVETLKNCYGQLADYLGKAKDLSAGARLRGGTLEGTFINKQMAGAQNPDLVLEPNTETFDSIEDRGAIKLVNVVPDAGQKSCELTKYLTDKGVIVGMGHTDATGDQVFDAIKAGLKYCIHFLNGPTGSSHKPFNNAGAVESVLRFDELYAELILDGFHVHPAYVRDVIKRKGIDRIMAMTDCGYVVGSPLKKFTIGGISGEVSDDGSYLRVVGKKNVLFGSTLTMNRGFNNLLNWLTVDMQGFWNRLHKALEFEDALVAISKIFSTNPCSLMSLKEQGYGSIVNGAKADLVVLDIAGQSGNYEVTVDSTIVDGGIVYSKK